MMNIETYRAAVIAKLEEYRWPLSRINSGEGLREIFGRDTLEAFERGDHANTCAASLADNFDAILQRIVTP